jgi:hypothetical protein
VGFIGHMYNNNLIKSSAIEYCMDEFIKNLFEIDYCVEITINFIKTVKDKYENTDNGRNNMRKYYNVLNDIKEKCPQKREKFLIQDLLEGKR